MKTFASRFAAHLIVAVATCGLIIQLAEAAPIKNAKCVTMLNPATCSSGGNSYCNAVAGGGNCLANSCNYCDDSNTTVANQNCANWEGNGRRSIRDDALVYFPCDPGSRLTRDDRRAVRRSGRGRVLFLLALG